MFFVIYEFKIISASHIAEDMRPINTVMMRGFKTIILYLAPSTYQIPSAYIIGKEIDDMYEELSIQLKTKFGKLTSVSITTDGWTMSIGHP